MKDLTERELQLLIGSVDLSISNIGGQMIKISPEQKQEARKTLSEYLKLQEKLNNIKTK